MSSLPIGSFSDLSRLSKGVDIIYYSYFVSCSDMISYVPLHHFNSYQRQFEEVKIEDIYIRYWLRLQRILLFKLLVVIIIYAIIWLILYNTVGDKGVSSYASS